MPRLKSGSAYCGSAAAARSIGGARFGAARFCRSSAWPILYQASAKPGSQPRRLLQERHALGEFPCSQSRLPSSNSASVSRGEAASAWPSCRSASSVAPVLARLVGAGEQRVDVGPRQLQLEAELPVEVGDPAAGGKHDAAVLGGELQLAQRLGDVEGAAHPVAGGDEVGERRPCRAAAPPPSPPSWRGSRSARRRPRSRRTARAGAASRAAARRAGRSSASSIGPRLLGKRRQHADAAQERPLADDRRAAAVRIGDRRLELLRRPGGGAAADRRRGRRPACRFAHLAARRASAPAPSSGAG